MILVHGTGKKSILRKNREKRCHWLIALSMYAVCRTLWLSNPIWKVWMWSFNEKHCSVGCRLIGIRPYAWRIYVWPPHHHPITRDVVFVVGMYFVSHSFFARRSAPALGAIVAPDSSKNINSNNIRIIITTEEQQNNKYEWELRDASAEFS